ncbi:hypothetical protein [Streptomyces anthocyanicus]|uniref:hypothetical protein n=1 Tax=Streptomyces anthocyanicus TaxID=68174 RepID=UPI0038730DB2
MPGQVALERAPDGASERGLLPDSLSDRGNAKLFVALHGRTCRYVPGLGWYRWSGYRWESDGDDAVLWAAGEMAEAFATTDPHGRYTASALERNRRRALSTAGMHAMLKQARSAPGMVLSASLLDARPHALCTPEGVIDLHTGMLRYLTSVVLKRSSISAPVGSLRSAVRSRLQPESLRPAANIEVILFICRESRGI